MKVKIAESALNKTYGLNVYVDMFSTDKENHILMVGDYETWGSMDITIVNILNQLTIMNDLIVNFKEDENQRFKKVKFIAITDTKSETLIQKYTDQGVLLFSPFVLDGNKDIVKANILNELEYNMKLGFNTVMIIDIDNKTSVINDFISETYAEISDYNCTTIVKYKDTEIDDIPPYAFFGNSIVEIYRLTANIKDFATIFGITDKQLNKLEKYNSGDTKIIIQNEKKILGSIY
jgi:hypothetical protein